MTKQEEIREVIDLYTDDGCLYPDKDCVWCSKEGYCASGNDSYTCLMKRLDGLGLVIKVDRELPRYSHWPEDRDPHCEMGFEEAIEEVKRAGYVAVDDLV